MHGGVIRMQKSKEGYTAKERMGVRMMRIWPKEHKGQDVTLVYD